MVKQTQVVKSQPEKKKGRKHEIAQAIQPLSEFAGILGMPSILCGMSRDGSIEAQAALLSDERLRSAQKQTLAVHIGHIQGTRHLQRVIAQIVQRRLTAAERAENLRSPQLAGDSRLEAAFDNRPPMRRGERGESVAKVQQALIDDGFAMPISTRRTGSPDGNFGRETTKTVKQFQRKHGLERDGEVGRETLRAMDTLYAGTPVPQPQPAEPHSVYQRKLNEAVAMLERVRFGRAVGGRVGRDPADRYDVNFWEEQVDPDGDAMLVLKPGKLPSDAIDAMFANLGRWKVDCAEFIQIAQWYALRHAYGADEFNRRMAELSFNLRPHRSTGIRTRELYSRNGSSEAMKRSSDNMAEPRSVDQLVADAPVGSRVAWTFLGVPTTHAFRNENTIKLGPDLFAAHGFRRTGQNTFTRRQLERMLARISNRHPTDAYIAENVFIVEIEYYETP